jgi:hypothetical protein
MNDLSLFIFGLAFGFVFFFGIVDRLLRPAPPGAAKVTDVRMMWAGMAALSGAMVISGYWTGPNWSVVVDAFLFGFSLMGIFVTHLIQRTQKLIAHHECEMNNLIDIAGDEIGRHLAAELSLAVERERIDGSVH